MQRNDVQSRFWRWFEDNGGRLRAMLYSQDAAAREAAAEELRAAVEQVEPGLVLEMGSTEDDQPQLVVSADGRPERVDAVKEFVATAPELPGWEVVAFRPRMAIGDSMEIVLEGERVGPGDVWFEVTEEEYGLGLTLHVRGMNGANQRMRGLGASLLAEHAVGERDALTLLNSLEVVPLADASDAQGLRPFRDLVGVFTQAREQKYPPPGQLDLNLENHWQNLQGTIQGALVLVLFHAGLAPLAGHPAYDRRLTVSIPFDNVDDSGMPGNEEEYEAVCDLGDQLAAVLQEGQQSLFALTVTTQGRRDLIFYSSNPEAALERLEEELSAEQAARIESSIEWDTYWGLYRSFLQTEAAEEEDPS